VRPRASHRFLREQVVLEPEARLAAEQGECVGEREQDQVVTTRRLVEEGAAIVDVNTYARVLVWTVRVVEGSEVLDLGVDFHGIDVPCPHGEGDGDVVAVSGADDQHVVECAMVDVPVGVEVEGLDAAEHRDRVGVLMGDVVDPDQQRVPARDGDDLVVRRPEMMSLGGL